MRYLDPPDGRPWALLALCGGSLLLNAVLATRLWMLQPIETVEVAAADVAASAAVAEVGATAGDAVADADVLPEPEAAAPAPPADGMIRIHAKIDGSLARTFQNATPEHGDVVSAVYARLFVWDLDLRRDLQRGDSLSVAYSWDGELAHIPVATYTSGKLGTLRAYEFQATGDAYPSWWDETGTEVPRRLVNGPLAEYEQITSLLKDRPSHKGMDFKTPVGTKVVTPKSGTVVRTDWNWKYNGNCVEVQFDDGVLAKFLHLSETSVKPGQRVSAGTLVGLSGNTGHSTAPHLHYQLEKGATVVDPVKYHGVERRKLSAGDMEAFDATRRALEATLDAPS